MNIILVVVVVEYTYMTCMYGVQHKPTPTGGAAAAWGSASLRNPPFAGAYFMFSFVLWHPRALFCSVRLVSAGAVLVREKC